MDPKKLSTALYLAVLALALPIAYVAIRAALA
jgi:hypothetical protein